ncbi:acyl-CoA reductase [Uliginosibacterium gangwonense]|uniref:acyl-CoA reductase n=1 Tax=Uliginosibacterium gangwonense TaxID=392736 RepID=UPI0003796E5C|nr:acyl-CoA reductase [Uliginosibacterium gangwonense]
MHAIELLIPLRNTEQAAITQRLDALQHAPLQAFSASIQAFLAAFADHILRDPAMRAAPELMALAYWFRPAALQALLARFQHLGELGLLRPRGVAFHVAPANVDSVFVYSWFLSLLCGNRNIVRLSRRENPQRDALLGILTELLARPEHAAIANANVVLAYERDNEISTALSARCNLRVVWGGDATVKYMRSLPLPPLATELVFPNRASWALIHAENVNQTSAETLTQMAGAFYNDTFWFAQQACSSPRALLWIGTPEQVQAAQSRFWPTVKQEIARRNMQDEPTQLAARLVAAHLAATEGGVILEGSLTDWPLRLSAQRFNATMRDGHCGYGLIYEIQRESLDNSISLFEACDQTVAYWGFEREALTRWALMLPDRAVDRIVPLGQALRFADRWDGHDLLLAFSRLVMIE